MTYGNLFAAGRPARLQILDYVDKASEPQSADQVTEALRWRLASTARHLRVLRTMGLLDVDRIEQKGSVSQVFYKAPEGRA